MHEKSVDYFSSVNGIKHLNFKLFLFNSKISKKKFKTKFQHLNGLIEKLKNSFYNDHFV